MNAALLVLLAMLGRLQDFLRAFPLGDEPGDLVVAQFMAKMDRLRAMVAQQQEGQLNRRALVGKHRELRRRITTGPLRQLARIAVTLKGEFAEVAAIVGQPVHRLGMDAFLATAQTIAATVQAQHDLLRARGMAPETLDDLTALLKEYEQALRGANAGRRAHTGARAELRALGKELIQMARQLDGIVVYHFRDDPEVLGAWKSARNVAWPTGEPAKVSVPVVVPQPEGQPVR